MIVTAILTSLLVVLPPDSIFEIQAVRTASAPIIDGVVSDEEWSGAAAATNFIQFEPARGEPGSQSTEALMLYDSAFIYVAYRVWDSEAPTAQLTRRDSDLFGDDAVVLLLDTHHDRQSGYVFMTNPLGAQTDGRIANDGRTVDYAWDESWESAATLTEWGWTAEIAVPLNSIRYSAGEDQVWGINFGRSLRRRFEVSFWSGPLENQLRVSQAGVVHGLDLPAPPSRHQIITYGLSRLQERRSSDWDAGVDVRYNLTSEMALDGTVNPDFATIEADQEQVNLTRFELSLREKRPFFLEGGELFRQRIRTFYTRRISDIQGGAKVLGKQGPWTLALLSTAVEPSGTTDDAFYNVARVQRDLGRSSVAMMWAERRLEGEGQGSVSMDATLFFTSTFGMTAQLVQSYGSFHDGTAAFFIRPSYDSPTGHFHVRYTHLGESLRDNANVIGFIRDDDRRELDSAIEKTLWTRGGAFERVSYNSNYNIYWGQDGTLRSWKIDEALVFVLRSRWAARVAHTEEFKLFEAKFRNRDSGVEIGYNTREFQSVRTGFRFGRNFDADFRLATAAASYKPTSESAVEYELQRLTLDPDPEEESTWIHVVRANQFFTNDLFLQLFFQTNSAIDRRNAQAVFVYRYKPPFGTIQLAFQRGTAEFGARSEQGNTLFLKMTAVF